MGCSVDRICIICRMLNWSKIFGIHIGRHNNHAAGMLTRCSFNTDTPLNKTFHFSRRNCDSLFFHPFFNKSECSFIGESADCSCFENMGFTEKLFGIAVGIELIFAREVKVDIRLFVTVEAKEGFKRNIMAVTVHGFSAHGTILRRHIVTRTVFAYIEKFTVLAILTYIVGNKRINFGNTGCKGNEGRTNRTS